MRGKPVTLAGPELKAGDPAPDFHAVDSTLQDLDLAATGSRVRIFSVVPSLDTPVCDAQTKRFSESAAALEQVEIYTISMDLPFAQKRWCGAFGVDNVRMISDHRDGSFGLNYGTLIPDMRIHCRAVFVIDSANVIRYAEYVSDISNHPDYQRILAATEAAHAKAATS